MKAQMEKYILKKKKKIYTSLTETVKENMTKCYNEAKEIEGNKALENMRKTIERHVYSNKKMYEEAKKSMLMKMDALKKIMLYTLQKIMKEAIEFSLKTAAYSLPDVSEYLETLTTHYNQLQGGQDEEMLPQ